MTRDFIPIRGGPRDGCEFLPPDDPRPGQRVNCGEGIRDGESPPMVYRINRNCTAVECEERK